MKFKLLIAVILFMQFSTMRAQENSELPYYEITEYAQNYTAGTVAARLIDGLGFRYYWVSEALTSKDLEYRLNEEGRSTLETLQHIYDLSTVIRDAALKVPHIKETLKKPMTYVELRSETLKNLKTASNIISKEDNLEQFNMVFRSPNGDKTVPFWNAINGPIEDAVWHCGQIAAYRRASGNSISSKVNHFMGTVNN
ncbi:hypothetical protein [Formosa sp. S-31]|uniref:hypothetical protein n=1 Tax=Formosa sp. S-31 TaxID=2790949 RepID=UPI003EBFCE5A